MKETETCSLCGQDVPAESLTEFDGELCCEGCLQAETVLCADCETRIWTSDNCGSERIPLCQRCFDDHYTTCSRCDRAIHVDRAYYDDEDESEPYCCTCHMERHRHCVINDYYYKPEPIFYGDGKRFFGVELEVGDAGECNDSAGCIAHIANTKAEHI